jgi:3-hydroxyisobutyrate dehydrogenase
VNEKNDTQDMVVGLVGLGAMGKGVACNLLAKGFEVVGHDVRADLQGWIEAQGGAFAHSLAELGRRCRVVVSFVVNDAQTEAVLYGPDGLVGHLSPGSVFIACSTMPPAYVQRLGERLAADGIHLLDAPVTGGAAGAARGSLTVITAGEKAVFEQVRPVLEAFGANLYHLGERHGAGSQLKVINQLLCGVHLAAAGEALALAQRQGLPLDITHEVLCSGAAFSWMLGDRGPRMRDGRFGDITSAVDIFVKDLGLVLATARESKFAAPLASAAFNAFLAVSGEGRGAWDDSAVMCHYARQPYEGESPAPGQEARPS